MRYGVVLFCLTLLGCSGNSTSREQRDVSNRPAKETVKEEEPAVDAISLWEETKANPAAAELKYKGKRLQVRVSRIARIDKSKARPGEWVVAAPVHDADKDENYERGAIFFFFNDPQAIASLKVGAASHVIAGAYWDFSDNKYVRLTACTVK